MLRLSVFLLLWSLCPYAQAQEAEHYAPSRSYAIMFGFTGLGGFPADDFAENVGDVKFGLSVFMGLQGPRLGAGLDFSGHILSSEEETVDVSGFPVDVTTTSDIVRMSIYGRYGFTRPLGGFFPYADIIAGANLLATSASLSNTRGQSNTSEGSQELATDVAPALGAGLGFALLLEEGGFPFILNIQARYVYGGDAEYEIYDEALGQFETRSSSTSLASIGVGFLLGF